MDSPEAAKASAAAAATATAAAAAAATGTSDSPPVQESPFSNYICNLSPIKPVKVAHAAQGYVGLNSPPLVFMSPPTLPQCETSIVQRTGCFQVQGVELAKDDDEKRKFGHGLNDLEKSFAYVSGRIIGDSQKNNDMKSFVQDLPGNSSNCDDDYFKMDSGNSPNSANASKEKCSAVLHSSESSLTRSEKVILEFDGKNDTRMRENSNKYEHPEKHPQEQTCLEIRTIKAIEEESGGEWLPNDYPSRDSNLFVGDSPKKLHYGTLGSQVVQVHEGDSKDVGDTLHEPHQNMASQLQRGMSRRCLQFKEAKCKTTMNSMLYPGPTNNSTGSRSPVSSTALESLNSPHLELTVSTGQKEMINLSRPILPSHYNGKPPSAMSRPSGIGLHLNSIVTALPMGCSTIASTKTDPVVNYQLLENKSSCSKISELLEKVPVIAEDGILGAEASLAENKRKFESEDADNFEVFNQSSPKKKRKKLSSIEADGCKRCNCKKTECLKLYCDCFAAGIYCAEPCACRGCFNRPEYEDTVLEFRQKIEARNPLAFSPKIVQRVTKVSAIHREDGYRLTSPSARHKKGCNCKKSMCLKKYCECYQANVGCSSGCRCEGCKNAYGRKEDYDVAEAVSNKATEDGLESTVDYKMEIMSSNKDINAELYDLQNFKPLTPSFQKSEHGKDAPYSRLIPSTYTPSPESDLSSLSYAKFAKARNLHDTMFSEISGGSLDKGSCDQGAGYNTAKMNDELSLECNGLADICDPNSLLNSSMTMASLGSSNGANISRVQWCPGSTHLSSGSSLRWRSSPLTPMTQLGETQRRVLGSDSGLYGILEDDTPEILNESSTLVASVKASSPNKKRVSPPRPIHELESGSSAVLKRGRKFILKAVPSFPPLTPCIDSKRNVDQQ